MMAVRWLLIVLGLIVAGLPQTAEANPKYAALVVHADTGDVLFDRYADDRRYPASLTKMMTLYLAFEAIEAGELSLDDEMTVSRRAAGQPASKLGLRRGSRIDVSTAIDALIIKSANDVATVMAEELGGTESRFAQLMTQRARELGMRSTTFRNASGLPDKRQVTTARDMAILSRRVVQDFPQFYDRFQKKTFSYAGRTYRSHNRVMLTMDGADGLKTGYTRASGYNLATTAQRGDHRLIGIVLGGRSGATRDRHMKAILNTAFVEIRRRPALVSPAFAARPAPRLKPGRTAPDAPVLMAAAAPAEAIATAAPVSLDMTLDPTRADDLNLDSLRVAIAEVASDDRAVDEAVYGQGDAEVADGPRDFVIQVGAFSRQNLAMARVRQLQDAVFAVQPEAGREVNIAERRGENVFRARFTELTRDEADAACAALSASDQDCFTLRVAD